MNYDGVILYGPPASGKDTIGNLLAAQIPTLKQFSRIKVGGVPKSEYRMFSEPDYRDLVSENLIVWENQRYGATYAVDRPELLANLAEGCPVIHLGQPAAVWAVTNAVPHTRWLIVELWCPRPVALERLRHRGSMDSVERLAAWDETPQLDRPSLRFDTSQVGAQTAADAIRARLVPPVPPVPESR